MALESVKRKDARGKVRLSGTTSATSPYKCQAGAIRAAVSDYKSMSADGREQDAAEDEPPTGGTNKWYE